MLTDECPFIIDATLKGGSFRKKTVIPTQRMNKKKWYRGKWRVNAEVASLVIEAVHAVTKRGIEIREEGKDYEFFSYHPAAFWAEEKAALEAQVALILSLFPEAKVDCQWEEFFEENWQENWRKYFRPRRISSKLIVLPAWEKYKPEKGEIALFIEPATAFGTGTHETTRLCLKAMEIFFPLEHPQSLLDVGTGTGILAIYGAKLGIKEIVAVDIDPLAIEAAQKNCQLNKVKNIKLIKGSITKGIGSFDWVVANLETKIILPIAELLTSCACKTLILSGILTKEIEEVKAKIRRCCREVFSEGEWACLVF